MYIYVQSLCILYIKFSALEEDFCRFPPPHFWLFPYSYSNCFSKGYNPVKNIQTWLWIPFIHLYPDWEGILVIINFTYGNGTGNLFGK